ncbi:MAG: methyltransferase domain-containing protein [Sedimentisphaerales bacterium]|nr:methyltransferase domain-containing protein [Sedimentisphaerales bacterium]
MLEETSIKNSLVNFATFNERMQRYVKAHPETKWHIHGTERRIWRALREIVGFCERGRVVDMGCLPPNFAIGMEVAGIRDRYEYLGLCSEEAGSELVEAGKKMGLSLEGVNLDPRFEMFDYVSKLPSRCSLEADTVDLVVMTEVLEHMVWTHSIIAEAKRILKPGGVIIGSTPNATNIGVVLKSIMGKGNFEQYSESHLASERWMKHVRFYSKSDLAAIFSEHGFELLKLEYHNYWNLYPEKGLGNWIKKTVRGMFYVVPCWRESLFFAVRKR